MAEHFYHPDVHYFVHRICAPGWVIQRQLIDFHDLTFVQNGRGEYRIDGAVLPVRQGDLLCIPPGSVREAQTDPDEPLKLFAFNFRLFDDRFEPARLPLPVLSHPGPDAKLEYLLLKTERIWAVREPTYRMQAAALFLETLCHLFLQIGVVKGTDGEPRVQKAASFVLEHIGERVSAGQLGEAIGLHPRYLNKIVLMQTGMTLSRFVTSIRVNMAEDALSFEGVTVGEAAARFGFSDIFHFSKVFKRFKGYPPSRAKVFSR